MKKQKVPPAADAIEFINAYIRDARPSIPFRDRMLREEEFLKEMQRAENLEETADERKNEEDETKKIIAALDEDVHQNTVDQKRTIQLMRNELVLQQLHHHLSTADTTMGRLAQIKREDAELDRKFEQAKEQAQDVRAVFKVSLEYEKEQEAKVKREADELCAVLKNQIVENDAKRRYEKDERIRDGQLLMEKFKRLEEQERKDKEAAEIARTQLRKEILENLHIRSEIRRNENRPNKNDLIYYFNVQAEREAAKQRLITEKAQKLIRQQKIADKLGHEVLEKNRQKEQAVTNLIDYWASWQENQNNVLYEKEQQKENEMRKGLQQNMISQEHEREAKIRKQIEVTREMEEKRFASSHYDSERSKLKRRMEYERGEQAKYMKLLKDVREEKKAKKQPAINTPWTFEYEQDKKEKEIEATRVKVLNQQPISLLRYLPANVRGDYLPQPLRDAVSEQVLRDPIPMFNTKRSQPHLKRTKDQGGDMIKCYKNCPPRKPISNIF